MISITLKGVEGGSYAVAERMLARVVNREARRITGRISRSRRLEADQEILTRYQRPDLDLTELRCALESLSEVCAHVYQQNVIILIDEYDAPLAAAWRDEKKDPGYYDRMVELLRGFLGEGLKTNDFLASGILTGCLRIAHESIFTGRGNLHVQTIAEPSYQKYFGFTEEEVQELLSYYALSDRYPQVRDWYDGYRFGNTTVFCPWDVTNYVFDHLEDQDRSPVCYWSNTSGNTIIRSLLENADPFTAEEIDTLLNGGRIEKQIRFDLTDKELETGRENLWSVLYMTGYLTGAQLGSRMQLWIPNQEILTLFAREVVSEIPGSKEAGENSMGAFCRYLAEGDPEQARLWMNRYLEKHISIRDASVSRSIRENFYHGLVLAFLSAREDWSVQSQRESGLGYSDILVITDQEIGLVVELKYADDGDVNHPVHLPR